MEGFDPPTCPLYRSHPEIPESQGNLKTSLLLSGVKLDDGTLEKYIHSDLWVLPKLTGCNVEGVVFVDSIH